MKKIFALSAIIVVIAVIFASCGSKPGNDTETSAVFESYATLPALPTEEENEFEDLQQTEAQTAAFSAEVLTEHQTSAAGEKPAAAQQPSAATTAPVTQQPETAQQPAPTQQSGTTTEKYKKTGTMHFSDSPDNKYLASVASKYNVDPSLLAAIYTVPDANGNIVLRFNGEKDSSGRLIRNESTLVCIYSIDKAFNSKCASEDDALNEYSYGEMKVMYLSATRYILPEFEKELSYK